MAKKRNTTGLGLLGGGLTDAPVTPQTRRNQTYVPPLGTISQATRTGGDDIAVFARNLMGAAQLGMKAASNWASVDRGQGSIAGSEALPSLMAQINAEDPNWELEGGIYDEDGKLRTAEIEEFVKGKIGDPGGSGWYDEAYEAKVYPRVLNAIYTRGAERRGEFIAGEMDAIVESILRAGDDFVKGGPLPTPVEYYEGAIDRSIEPLFGFYPKRGGEDDDSYRTRLQGIWYGTVAEPMLEEVALTGNLHLFRALTNRNNEAYATEMVSGRDSIFGASSSNIVLDPSTGGVVPLVFNSPLDPDWKKDKEARWLQLTSRQYADALAGMQRGMYEHTRTSIANAVALEHVYVKDLHGSASSLAEQTGEDGLRHPVSNAIFVPWVHMGQGEFVGNQEAVDRAQSGDNPLQDGSGPLLTSDVKPLIGGSSIPFIGSTQPLRNLDDLDKWLRSGAVMSPNSPIHLTAPQIKDLRREYLEQEEDDADALRVFYAMNNIGGNLVHSDDDTRIMDYLKNQGLIDERGVFTNGVLAGGQFANIRRVPKIAADMIFSGLSRTDKDTEPLDDIAGLVASMYQVGGQGRAAFNDLIRQAAGQPNRLFLETTLQAIGDNAEAMGLFTPDGNLSVNREVVLQSIRAQVHSLRSVEDVDPNDADAAFGAMHAADIPKATDGLDVGESMADAVGEHVQTLLQAESDMMGEKLRIEMGLGVAIDVSEASLSAVNEGHILRMYKEVIHGLYVNDQLTGTDLADAARKAFYVRFRSEYDFVVTDDHIEGNPKGRWVYSANMDAGQRWYQPLTTGQDGTQQMQLPPWTLLQKFVEGNPDRFVSNGSSGKPETVFDWDVTKVSPAPSGKGWVLWTSFGTPITWTPEKPDDWKTGDAVPQRELFIFDLEQARRWSQESGFDEDYRKAMAHQDRPQDRPFNLGNVLRGYGPSIMIEMSKRVSEDAKRRLR